METIKVLLLAIISFINLTQITSLSVGDIRRNSLFSRGSSLESMNAILFKLRPERNIRHNDQHRLNASRPACNTAQQSASVTKSTNKPTTQSVPDWKHADYLTKFSYFINVPVMHPFEKYKIIVVTAPPYIKFGARGTEPLVVYMVFNDDTTDDSKTPSMPEVYFVTQQKGEVDLTMKQKHDQVWIINNNRTVTGIKSKDVPKFVDFRKQKQPLHWRSGA